MTDTNGTQIIDEAADVVEHETEDPMSLEEFIDLVLEEPQHACSSAEYLLRAIEHFETRTVTEHGEEIERYRFFDDPANEGEHAILGNTELLNSFVGDVRRIARGAANEEKMFWFEGPTATGKSELKRCLVNGLEAFSQTDEGKRYTIEWNLLGKQNAGDAMTYGEGPDPEQNWIESPVQTNPLSVLPEEIRRRVLHGEDADPSEWTPTDLDPFSEEIYRALADDEDNSFEDVVDSDHFRVSRYTVELGRGIGSLQSEDEGRPAHKLVGEWMPGMVERLDSRGRRNPQALSYDGVLSQGNSGISIIEDASYHFPTIQQMLSIPEDDEVKIDRRTILPVDTVPIIISNPDMAAELMKDSDKPIDSMRPIRRRLDRYRVNYLITPSIEAELLHRLIVGYEDVWDDDEDRMRESVHFDDVELAPHALEAAAFYNVSTRLSEDAQFTPVQRARLYDGEEIEMDGIVYTGEDIPPKPREGDARDGIPCTYTKDVIAELAADKRQDGEPVIMPFDVTDAMFGGLDDSPLFGPTEIEEYGLDADQVDNHILDLQEQDVLDAMLREHTVSEDEIEEYVEHVYSWGTDEDTIDPDPLRMKVFETEHLGRFAESHYGLDTASGVSEQVEQFRNEEIIQGVSAYLYGEREDYEDITDVPLSEFPALQELLEDNDWNDVDREFDDLELGQWLRPPSNTETERIKEETIDNMVDMFTYSEESARKTTDLVVSLVAPPEIEGAANFESDDIQPEQLESDE